MHKIHKLFEKIWPLRSEKDLDPYLIQQAVRRASRGPRSTLFHLLFPICLTSSFTFLYLLPMLIAWYWESSWIAQPLLFYVKWSLPVFIVVNLVVYNWARNWLLAPHIRELTREQVDDSHPVVDR